MELWFGFAMWFGTGLQHCFLVFVRVYTFHANCHQLKKLKGCSCYFHRRHALFGSRWELSHILHFSFCKSRAATQHVSALSLLAYVMCSSPACFSCGSDILWFMKQGQNEIDGKQTLNVSFVCLGICIFKWNLKWRCLQWKIIKEEADYSHINFHIRKVNFF